MRKKTRAWIPIYKAGMVLMNFLDEPRTARELAALSGFSLQTVYRTVRLLPKLQKYVTWGPKGVGKPTVTVLEPVRIPAWWLYQLAQNRTPRVEFLEEVAEFEVLEWPVGRKATTRKPRRGDYLVLAYAKTGAELPGIHAWALVLGWSTSDDGTRHISFQPLFPSNAMKVQPVWNPNLETMLKHVRGGTPEGTMWRLPKKHVERMRTLMFAPHSLKPPKARKGPEA
jgi:hypothetical protein